MPRYRWTGVGPYHDNRNGRVVESGDVVELDEHVAAPNDELVRVEDAATFDEEEWLEADYRTRAERVKSGEFDAHLDVIDDIETSQTVTNAVAERRED